MTHFRRMKPIDMYKMNLTNLDPYTENYDIGYYLNYMINWPSLCFVAESIHTGYIQGYSKKETPSPHPQALPQVKLYLTQIQTIQFWAKSKNIPRSIVTRRTISPGTATSPLSQSLVMPAAPVSVGGLRFICSACAIERMLGSWIFS